MLFPCQTRYCMKKKGGSRQRWAYDLWPSIPTICCLSLPYRPLINAAFLYRCKRLDFWRLSTLYWHYVDQRMKMKCLSTPCQYGSFLQWKNSVDRRLKLIVDKHKNNRWVPTAPFKRGRKNGVDIQLWKLVCQRHDFHAYQRHSQKKFYWI